MFFRWHQDPPNTPSLLRCHQKALNEGKETDKSQTSPFPLISPAMMGSLIAEKEQNLPQASSIRSSVPSAAPVINLVDECEELGNNGFIADLQSSPLLDGKRVSLKCEERQGDEKKCDGQFEQVGTKTSEFTKINTTKQPISKANALLKTKELCLNSPIHQCLNGSASPLRHKQREDFIYSFGQPFYDDVKKQQTSQESTVLETCDSQLALFSSEKKQLQKLKQNASENDYLPATPRGEAGKNIYCNLSGTFVDQCEVENIFFSSPSEPIVTAGKGTNRPYRIPSQTPPTTVSDKENTLREKKCRISDSLRSSESESPTKRLLERYLNRTCAVDASVITPQSNSTGSISMRDEYPAVWAKINQNEFRLAELIGNPQESSTKISVSFYGSKTEVLVRKQDTFPCNHRVGDVVLVPSGRFGIICKIFCGSKSFEILPVEGEHELVTIASTNLQLLQETTETCAYYAEQIYLNNLLMKRRQGVLLFSTLSFIVTWGESAPEQLPKYDRRLIEYWIRDNGGTLLVLKDNQLVNTKLVGKHTILLAEHPKRTVKFIYSICNDIPRLKMDWLYECMKIGELLPYSKFLLPNSTAPNAFPPPRLRRKLFLRQLFRLKGSHSFKLVWQTIIQSLAGTITSKASLIQLSQGTTHSANTATSNDTIITIDENQRCAGSSFQTLLQCIIDQSNYFQQGTN